MRENRFIQRDEPLLTVRKHKILLYVSCQMIGVLASVAISQTIAAIGKLKLSPRLPPIQQESLPKGLLKIY